MSKGTAYFARIERNGKTVINGFLSSVMLRETLVSIVTYYTIDTDIAVPSLETLLSGEYRLEHETSDGITIAIFFAPYG